MTNEVQEAVRQLRVNFPELVLREDDEGGAYVIVEQAPLGPPYKQADTWVGFHITFQYPYADIYPLFVRSDLERVDGSGLGTGTAPNQTFEGRAGIQLSRKSNHLNPAIDTAILKVLKVLQWLKSK